MPAANPPAPAATLVVFRRAPTGGPAQLLMLDRAQHMRFAPGATVFPGGRVDPEDHRLARAIAPDHPDEAEVAARIAALRETLEETGLVIGVRQAVTAEAARAARACVVDEGSMARVLERFGWTLTLDRLVPFARWCPDFDRAFDTRFYLADLGTGAVELEVDGTENTRLFWSSAADLLDARHKGQARAIYPTIRNLERLALFDDFASTAAHAGQHPIATITPWREERDGVPHLVIPEGLGYPVTAEPLALVCRG